MKLIYPDYKFHIEFSENVVNQIIVENPNEFSRLISELLQQINNDDGRFVLSEESKILKLSSKMQCIINPFALELNSKKVIDRLYELCKQEVNQSDQYIKFEELTSQLEEFICNLEESSVYPLTHECNGDVKALLKYVGLRMDFSEDNLLERVVDYIRINHELLGNDIFVLVNIKTFLNIEELELLYKAAVYDKIHLLLLESQMTNQRLEQEITFIIDKDLCEIY